MSKWILCAAAAVMAAALTTNTACAEGLGLRAGPASESLPPLQTPESPMMPSAAGAGESSVNSDGIAAVVGNQIITQYDLQLRVRAAEQQIAQQGGRMPPLQQLRAELLNQMINQLALSQFAEASGITVSSDTVDRAAAQVAAGYQLTPEQFRKQIEAQGLGWQDYKEQIKREILIGRLRERDVISRIHVSDQEIDDYLAKQANRAPGADTPIELAQIFIPLPDKPTAAEVDAAKIRMDAALAKLHQGRRFEQVAAEYSQGPEAKNGGSLGVRPAGQWPSLFMDAIRGLKPGQITGVIRSPAGFHIVELQAEGGQQAATTAMQSHVREIVIDTNGSKSREAAMKELASVRDAVMQGSVDFGAKARELSQDVATAKNGGDLGWVLPGELAPALDAAVNRLNPGQLSDPIALPGKVVLLQLLDRREHALAQDQERAVVRNIILQQKEAKEFDELVKDVRAQTYVRMPDAEY